MNAPDTITDAIVIQALHHTDTTMVVTMLTKDFGRTAMVVSTNRRGRKQSTMPLLAPLTLVTVAFNSHHGNRLPRITEIHCRYPLSTIPFNAVRRSIALFMGELLARALRDEGRDDNLYNLIDESIRLLDSGVAGEHNFHILFMYRLAAALGFEPDLTDATLPYFDMVEGIMTSALPLHRHYLMNYEKELFARLYRATFDNLGAIASNIDERTTLIKILEEYYRHHLPQFEGLNSPYILSLLR